MKGIILCAGKATRMYPITLSTPKALVGVYDKPLIYYSLCTLMESGITQILIITPPGKTEWFKELMGDGSQWGLSIEYIEQSVPKGIADAFIIGEEFIGKDNVCLILGDNIFYHPEMGKILSGAINKLDGAVVFGIYVSDPRPFGVIEFDKDNKVISIEEKPENPKSNYIVPGLYYYNNEVVKIAKALTPSARGELEITHVNEQYLKNGKLYVEPLPKEFIWHDVGSAERTFTASECIKNIQEAENTIIGSADITAYKKGYIDINKLNELAEKMNAAEYGKYITKFCKNNITV